MLRFASLLERQSFRRFPPSHFQTERLKPHHNSVSCRRNALNPLSFAPSCRGNLLFGNCSTNVCSPFKSRLRAYFDFRTKTQRPSPPLHPKAQRKAPPNAPLKDLFFARKSCRFYVPKMHLKNANGCSVCAWLLTSGGLRPAMRLRRIAALALRHQPKPLKGPPRLSFRLRPRAGADQAHTLPQTNRPLNRLLSLCKITNAGKYVCTTKSAAGSGAVPAEPLGIGYRFSPPRARLYAFALLHNTPAIAFVNAVAY